MQSFFCWVVLGIALASGARASAREQAEAALVEAYVAVVQALPELPSPRSAAAGYSTPLSKTITRGDGVTLSVFAEGMAPTADAREVFTRYADQALALAVLRLPRLPAASPEAAGRVEYRLRTASGVVVLLGWRRDEPFASAGVLAEADTCAKLLPPFDPPAPPPASANDLVRSQVYARAVAGVRYTRSASWMLAPGPAGTPQWRVQQEQRCSGASLSVVPPTPATPRGPG